VLKISTDTILLYIVLFFSAIIFSISDFSIIRLTSALLICFLAYKFGKLDAAYEFYNQLEDDEDDR